MATNPPNDPKSGSDKDETRHDKRGGGGPNNPLPGEPGGPTSGFSDEDRKAAEEGQRRDKPADQSKR